MTLTLNAIADKYADYLVDLDEFDMGNEVGQGGFSSVYIGRERATNRRCAIKILKCKRLEGDDLMLFEREISILAAGNSRFLLEFIGFTATKPWAIITLYVPNGSLWDVLRDRRDKALTGTQKTKIAYGVAYGMKKMHALSIVHRDLKSLNVLLDERMLPVICDFGLSRFTNTDSEYMTRKVGTANWTAPELFETGDYTEKVDVYSYAVMLWELLTGRCPFSNKTSVQIAVAVGKNRQRPSIPKETPLALRGLIKKCWHPDPEQRPSFEDICKLFQKHVVYFEGTNWTSFDKLIRELRTSGKSSYSRSRRSAPTSLGNVADQDFANNLVMSAATLTPDKARGFFRDVGQHFKSETDPRMLGTIVRECAALLDRPELRKAFIEQRLIERIPMSTPELTAPCLYLLKALVQAPDIDLMVLDQFTPIMKAEAKKVLKVLDDVGIEERVTMVLTSYCFALQSAGLPFLQCCYKNVKNNLSMLQILNQCFAREDLTEGACQILNTFWRDSLAVNTAELARGLVNSDAPAYFLLKVQVITSGTFDALLRVGKIGKQIIAYRCRDFQKELITKSALWLTVDNMLILLAFATISDVGLLPQFAFILTALCTPEKVKSLVLLLNKVQATHQNVSSLNEAGFFEKFFATVSGSKDSTVVCYALLFAEKALRIGLIRGVDLLLPLVNSLMVNNYSSWALYCVPLLTSLSVYPQAHNSLKQYSFTNIMQRIDGLSEFKQHSNVYLSNMNSAY